MKGGLRVVPSSTPTTPLPRETSRYIGFITPRCLWPEGILPSRGATDTGSLWCIMTSSPGDDRYCHRCGSALERRQVGDKVLPVCPHCGNTVFSNPKLAVAVIVEIEGKLLLQRRAR